MKTNYVLLWCLALVMLLSCTMPASPDPIPLAAPELVKKLSELKPLPKVHYSWSIERSHLLDNEYQNLAYEYARISHALSIDGYRITEPQLETCVMICAKVNRSKPKIPCVIGINYSPWHYKFEKELPPTDRGPSYYQEISFFKYRMEYIKSCLDKINKKYATEVSVGALLLDCERFHAKENYEEWNNAIRESLDVIHTAAREIYPNARIEWFSRGVSAAFTGDGWKRSDYFTTKEIKASLSAIIYTVPEIERMRETYRKTCKLADTLGINDVTPWIALASGYKRSIEKGQVWTRDWDYDPTYSWLIGSEMNHPWYAQRPERFAPYDRAKVIVLYPSPFYPQSPSWGKHFIAYVRGAHHIKKLDDLGVKD